MTDLGPSTTLARTWNSNESGMLWERLWIYDENGYRSDLVASGVFVPPKRYENAERFWKAFEDERAFYHGERF